MADLLELSARFIDGKETPTELGPVNRITLELSEVADNVAMVEAFSHIVIFRTDDGLVLFDTTLESMATAALGRIRTWSNDRVNTMVYTHGHIDHVGGGQIFVEEALVRGDNRPQVVSHEAVPERFDRYRLTSGYNNHINNRQFSRTKMHGMSPSKEEVAEIPFGPSVFVEPNTTYRDAMSLTIGDTHFELHHSRGETDDHTWTWVPHLRAICMGDLLIWAFPNAGNPQKVQRFPHDWAVALREMAALQPELLLPAHGLPIDGVDRIQLVLGETASALEHLVAQTIAMMNAGETLNNIIHTVRVPDSLLERPWLQPVYDEPEFVVRNIWRFYGGWYDGNPARLKPARDNHLAEEIVLLSGGVEPVMTRALTLADTEPPVVGGVNEDLRLACQLIEWAFTYAEQRGEVSDALREAMKDIYRKRLAVETSLMAKSIYGEASKR